MIKVIKCFKGATHVDKFNKRYKAKTTFIIKSRHHSVKAITSRMECLSARTLV